MRIIFSVLLLIYIDSAEAKTYYFSAISGNDSRTFSQAQSSATPWKTLNKLNSFFSSLQPGDVVLFKRGETFYGSIIASQSGSTTRPITIGAYGTGNRPVITGMQTLSDWSHAGNGRYESYNPYLGNVVNMVTVNGTEYAMGRYPNSNAANSGYLNFESHGTHSLTDKQLNSSPGWKGAELVVRTNRYVIDRVKITSHSGSKISYSPALSYEAKDGFGYFIQNDVKTLDQLGEWYYNPSTKKMSVYFGANSPQSFSVKASALANVVYIYNKDNIQFDNLTFTGGNICGVYLYSTDNIVLKNCDINFSGVEGISANNTKHLRIESSNIVNSNNIALNLSNSTNGLIRNNQIKNTAIFQGMGQNSANKSLGIRETGRDNLIEYNHIIATGYIGIRFGGDNCLIKNNLINNFNLTKDDGGGIYTSSSDKKPHYGQKIIGNIVLNGIGAADGTNFSIASSTSGIYLDDDASNVEVINNTVAYCNKAGILIHNSQKITLLQNTVFSNKNQQILMSHNMTQVSSVPLRHNTLKNNVFFSKDAAQGILNISSVGNDIGLAGTMDSNYYCRPLDDNFVMKTAFVNSSGKYVYQDCDLQAWRSYYKKDVATKRTAVQIVPHKVHALIGSNKFANGKFSSDISGTNIYTTAASFSKSWIRNKIDGGTLQVVTSSKKPGVTTVTVPVGSVSTSKKYIIGFSVKNSKDTLMYVYARQAGAPYKVLSNNGVKTILRMTTEKKEYELAFTPTLNEAKTLIFLETPSQNNTWWLDNIKVYEANITETNPDDSIRFEYNASQAMKTFALDGTYVDAKGNAYKNSLVLKPYASAVLVKKDDIAASPGNVAPTVSLTSPTVNSKYKTPATINLVAAAKDADGRIKKVEFFNGRRLIHTEFIHPYTFSWENVGPGNYTVSARAVDNSGAISKWASVSVSVVASTAPAINITSPKANATFSAPSTIVITAKASDPDGTIKRVEFYHGKTLLKTEKSAPYTWSWTKVAAGKYTITAKAIDNSGKVTVSSGIAITVKAPSVTMGPPDLSQSPVIDSASTHSNAARPTVAENSYNTPGLKLFPNPVIDKIQVSFNELPYNQKANISVVDLLGKTVRNVPVISGKKIEVDVSSLSSGIYILRFWGDNFVVNEKFVKKN